MTKPYLVQVTLKERGVPENSTHVNVSLSAHDDQRAKIDAEAHALRDNPGFIATAITIL